MIPFENTIAYAKSIDEKSGVLKFRKQFHIPVYEGNEVAYFCGNSLGLQPRKTAEYLQQELADWANQGVEGHFHGKNPWFYYHHFFTQNLAKIVGALPHEVVAMNNLTVNLHLMMASFYRPKAERYKIIMEAGAFPSDMYAVESQVKLHGYDYDSAVIEIKPREGETSLRTEDILKTMVEHGKETALVFFSGVQYYTGQLFNIAEITKAAHAQGAIAGFDLAHAAGNVALKLHDWDVDFAAWCGYKYMNSGPGAVSGVFVHEKHGLNPETPRLAGWWGHKEDVRFKMERGFIPEPGADGWQLSNAPVLNMVAHKASLELFAEAGMDYLATRGLENNAYMRFVVEEACKANPKLNLKIITPAQPESGCQVSMLTGENGKDIFNHLNSNGVVTDWREPNVIRCAAVPLYNTFEDIWRLGEALASF